MSTSHRLYEKSKPNTLDERHRMIAEAANYLSEKRGFQGNGQEQMQDWLNAEKETEMRLSGRYVGGVAGFFEI
jgi:hypothetical protein